MKWEVLGIVQSRYDFQRETNDVTPLIDATRGSSGLDGSCLSTANTSSTDQNRRLSHPFDCYCLMAGLIA
jgi:hypothetical protein